MIKIKSVCGLGDRLNMKALFRVSGVILMFYIVINFYVIVLVAAFNDGSAAIHFNYFNEGLFEYIMYLVIFPIIFYSFVLEIKIFRKERRNK